MNKQPITHYCKAGSQLNTTVTTSIKIVQSTPNSGTMYKIPGKLNLTSEYSIVINNIVREARVNQYKRNVHTQYRQKMKQYGTRKEKCPYSQLN